MAAIAKPVEACRCAAQIDHNEEECGKDVEADLTVEVPAVKKQPARTQDFRYADLSRAVVQVEFSRGHDSAQGSHGEADDAAETDFSEDTDEEN